MTLAEVIDTLQTWIRNADDEYDREEMGRIAGLKEALHEIKKIEPCENAISRQAVLNILDDMVKDYINENDFDKARGIAWVKVQKLTSVSSSENPNKSGTWRKNIDNSRRWDRVRFYCSECGGWQTYGETDYCPSCGAKMKGGD